MVQITAKGCLIYAVHQFTPIANTEIPDCDDLFRKKVIFLLLKWQYCKIDGCVKEIPPLKKKSKRGSKSKKWKKEKNHPVIN